MPRGFHSQADFCRTRTIIHEAGHALALMAMGYEPVAARAFMASTTHKGNDCHGYVELPTAFASAPWFCKAYQIVAGVAAEDYAVEVGLLAEPSARCQLERQECRNGHCLNIYGKVSFV